MRKIVVTGGAGYIGSKLCQFFLNVKSDIKVHCIDSLDHGGGGLIGLSDCDRFSLEIHDVRDCSLPEDTTDVVHLAAIVGEAACDRCSKDTVIDVNENGTSRVLEEAVRLGARALVVSTCSNYGVTAPGQLADENTKLNPLSLYAETKVTAERIATEHKAQVLRLATVCGVSTRMRFDLLVNDLARHIAFYKEFEIYGSKAWRPFVHIKDVCRATATMLNSDFRGGAFNIVGENLMKEDLVRIANHHYPNYTGIIVNEKDPDCRDYKVSGNRALLELGFKPAVYTVDNALRDVVDVVPLFDDPFSSQWSA